MRFSAILTIGLLAVAVAGPAAAADPAHVTCVGDSITYGSGTTTPSTDSYPAQLQKLLGAGYAVQNDGRSGATMLVGGDLPYTTTTEYTAATTFAAAGGDVVIQLGTNDTKPQNWTKKAQFAADCESLVAHYQAAAGKPRVWVNLPPPVFDPSCCGIASATMRDEVVPLLKQCAAAKGASTIDVFGALSGQGAHFSDGRAPHRAGRASGAREAAGRVALRHRRFLHAPGAGDAESERHGRVREDRADRDLRGHEIGREVGVRRRERDGPRRGDARAPRGGHRDRRTHREVEPADLGRRRGGTARAWTIGRARAGARTRRRAGSGTIAIAFSLARRRRAERRERRRWRRVRDGRRWVAGRVAARAPLLSWPRTASWPPAASRTGAPLGHLHLRRLRARRST